MQQIFIFCNAAHLVMAECKSQCRLQGNQRLAVPHVDVPDISWVDWQALRQAGFQGCVFDKDNTLTEPYALAVHPRLVASLEDCRQVFGGQLVLFSNSAGLRQFDPQGVQAKVHVAAHV